jgi:hypothetical protein
MATISNQGKALYAWSGSEWIPLNGGTNFSTIQRWNKIFDGGETTISGNDENDNLLIYTPGYEQVYLNGILLVRNEDYTAIDGVEINLSSPLNENDVLDIIIFIPVNIGNTYTRQQANDRFLDQAELQTINNTIDESFQLLSASVQFLDETKEPDIPYIGTEPEGSVAGTLWVDSTNNNTPKLKVYNGERWILVSGGESGFHPFFLAGT